MLDEVLLEIYERDLANLKAEIEKYEKGSDLWLVKEGITNSAGNLCLHLAGNLQHFFGAILGDTGYVRDREAEFASKDLSKAELLNEVDAALESVRLTLTKLTDEDLAKTYPIEVFGRPMTTEYFMVHLATHLTYHLGQINYHRRLTTAKA